jgi:hypothetical protein
MKSFCARIDGTEPSISFSTAKMTDIRTLTGANMAIRREVFDRVVLFNEALDPSLRHLEDIEFAQRVYALDAHRLRTRRGRIS